MKYDITQRISLIKSRTDTKSYLESFAHFAQELNPCKRYKCPFCGSGDGFSINPKNNKWKCWSCTPKEGDMIDFEQQKNGATKEIAIQIVEHNLGIGSGCDIQVSPVKNAPKTSIERQKKKSGVQIPGKEKIHWESFIERLDKEALEDTLEDFFTHRNFGKYTQQAVEIARNCCVGIYKHPDYGYNNLAFPVYDKGNIVCGVHTRSLPDGRGYKGFVDGSQGKGYFFFDRQSEIVFLVEGIIKAIALTCLGYSVICIYGKGNVDYCVPIAQKLRPDKRLVLWLDSGTSEVQIQKEAMRKYGIEGIFWKNVSEGNYGLDNLLEENPDNFENAVTEYLRQLPISVSNVKNALSSEKHVCNIISSPTGSGKTKEKIEKLSAGIWQDHAQISFTDTVNNVDKDCADLGKTFNERSFGKILASTINDEDFARKRRSCQEIKKTNLSHYYWLGFKGHRPETYALTGYTYQIESGKEKRRAGILLPEDENEELHIYCDEFHQLFLISEVFYDLAKVFLKHQAGKNVWYIPTEEYQGFREHTFVHWPEYGKFNSFEYWRLPESAIKSGQFTSRKNLDFLGYTFEELQNPDNYTHLVGNVFYLDLKQAQIKTELPGRLSKDVDPSEYDYLKELYQYLYCPRILCEFPIKRENGQPIHRQDMNQMYDNLFEQEIAKLQEEQQGINEKEIKEKAAEITRRKINEWAQVPKHPAYLPKLTGHNLLPFIQLLKRGTYLNAFSATLDDTQVEIIRYVCDLMKWKFQHTDVKEAQVKFKVRVLVTDQRIPYTKQVELQQSLIQTGRTKTLNVVWKESNLETLWSEVDKNKNGAQEIKKQVARFVKRNFRTEFLDTPGKEANIWTYDGASILQGENLFYHNNTIMEGCLFIPTISLSVGKCQSKKEVLERMDKRIQARATQIAGRLLRDIKANEQRKPGEIIVSEKIITILVHSRPAILTKIQIDDKVCQEQKIILETENFHFCSRNTDYLVESLVDAIDNLQQGKPLINWKQKDAEIATAEGKAQRHMSRNQRKSISVQKYRQEKKASELEEKAKKLHQNGFDWRNIVSKLHLNRYPEIMGKIKILLYEQRA